MPSVIQGLDTIPIEIQRLYKELFEEFLPGWDGAGEYNFRAGASSQRAAAQLEVLMQKGPHPYINNQIKALLDSDEFDQLLPGSQTLDDSRTKRLAALVNFMGEASGTEAIRSGGTRTGGYIAFSSASDPHLIARLGYAPNPAQMTALAEQGLSWANIMAIPVTVQ